jgi:ribulose-5-phosphate 4-epimerase/fuculose-1-phosphate aldolase
MQSLVTPEEWDLRVNLAACYRIVAHYGWDDLVFTHISARVPGTEPHFLINPYGMMFEEVTASSLVKVDLHGKKVMESEYDINPAGFTIHSAIHEAREDAQCVLHLHTNAGVAVAALAEGLQPYSQQSMLPLSNLAYHDYEGVALREDEKARLVADLGQNQFLMLRSHGLLTTGGSVQDAFLNMYFFQRSCEIQLLAQATGQPLVEVPAEIIATVQEQGAQVTHNHFGGIAWPGILRKLDRHYPGFRD